MKDKLRHEYFEKKQNAQTMVSIERNNTKNKEDSNVTT